MRTATGGVTVGLRGTDVDIGYEKDLELETVELWFEDEDVDFEEDDLTDAEVERILDKIEDDFIDRMDDSDGW